MAGIGRKVVSPVGNFGAATAAGQPILYELRGAYCARGGGLPLMWFST